MDPPLGAIPPAIAWSSVDFPTPFGPTMPIDFPGSSVNETSEIT